MGIVYQFVPLLILPLMPLVWVAPAAASPPALSDLSQIANQPYQPPDNGGPDGTIGSGTR